MIFTVPSNILLDNTNSLTSSSLDEYSKTVFTCNRNEMSALDKTHPGMKKNFCLYDLPGWDASNFIQRVKYSLNEKLLLSIKTYVKIYHVVQCCRLYRNIKTFNNTKDEFPHIYFLRTLPRLLEHRFQEQLLIEKNVKWEVFYINSCPEKSCSTMHL